MAEDRCKHDMLPGTCAWCRGLRDTAVEALTGAPRRDATSLPAGAVTIVAEYRTPCPACDGWIEIDEEIVLSDVGWVHIDHLEYWSGTSVVNVERRG